MIVFGQIVLKTIEWRIKYRFCGQQTHSVVTFFFFCPIVNIILIRVVV